MKATATPVDTKCYDESTKTVNIQCDDSLTEMNGYQYIILTEMNKCGSFLDVKILQNNYCETPNLAEFVNSFGHLDRLVISSIAMNFTQIDQFCCSVGLPLVKKNKWKAKSIPSDAISATCEPETKYLRRVGNRIIRIAKSDKIFGLSLWLFVAISFAITIAITLAILFLWK